MKKLPIGIQSFEKLITGNYLYVDKTEYIYQLITKGDYYFLSRPRRFGKSLLVSTLKELFEGKKELFNNLWISTSDYAWKEYTVIHLDFSRIAHRTSQQLEQDLLNYLQDVANVYDLSITLSNIPERALAQLVITLAKDKKVVILVDEYDYPILTHLHNLEIARAHQAILRSFYTVIKSLDPYLHFVFLTGVSKFSRTSIFSGLNNLIDISNTPAGAALLGYTQQELENYFLPYIKHLAEEQNTSSAHLFKQVQQWYNGYRFSSKNISLYNPYSVLLYVHSGIIDNYWFETGTPSFLVNILREKYKSLENITTGKISVSSLGTFDIENIPLITLLFQTGYLTIKAFDTITRKYRLGLANKEVEISFEKQLMTVFTYQDTPNVDTYLEEIRNALETKNVENFFIQLKSLFAHIPYHLHIQQEKYYHSLFQLMGSMLGMDIQSEVATDTGRIDLTLITKKYIYILEFKFNQTAEQALKQIERKKYYQKYLTKKKTIILIGVSFNKTKEELEITFSAKEIKHKG